VRSVSGWRLRLLILGAAGVFATGMPISLNSTNSARSTWTLGDNSGLPQDGVWQFLRLEAVEPIRDEWKIFPTLSVVSIENVLGRAIFGRIA